MLSNHHLSLRELLERGQAEPQLRQRVAALAGVSVFFAGALVAAGLAQVVIVVAGSAALAGVVALTAARLPRRSLTSLRGVTTAWRAARPLPAPPTAGELYGWPYAGSDDVAPAARDDGATVDDEWRRGVECNARGAELRRGGSPAAAVALHLEALEIFRSLNDRRAEAPTLNSLALALAASGETDAAVARFEQSLSILRERPDDPERGKVIANLAFTLLREGADERARELLTEALDVLPPESRAAHQARGRLAALENVTSPDA
ncbi:MAG TPA: tetratricopeptide repeat protein [Gaiellaceae bacterium]